MSGCQQVALDVTAANASAANDKGPEFAGSVKEKVAAGAATFSDSVVKWERPLKADGEMAVVEATLLIGASSSEWSGAGRFLFPTSVLDDCRVSQQPSGMIDQRDGRERGIGVETVRCTCSACMFSHSPLSIAH